MISPTGCVTLDKLLNSFEPPFLCIYKEDSAEAICFVLCCLRDGALRDFATLVTFIPGTLESEGVFLNVSPRAKHRSMSGCQGKRSRRVELLPFAALNREACVWSAKWPQSDQNSCFRLSLLQRVWYPETSPVEVVACDRKLSLQLVLQTMVTTSLKKKKKSKLKNEKETVLTYSVCHSGGRITCDFLVSLFCTSQTILSSSGIIPEPVEGRVGCQGLLVGGTLRRWE